MGGISPDRLKSLDDLTDAEVRGQRVLVRVDFNVPMDGARVLDDTRLVQAFPTLRELQGRGARLALVSHRGRPKGERNLAFSLEPVATRMAELLETPVAFAGDCVGSAATEVVDALGDGEIALLENLRFHAGETDNDPSFVQELAAVGDTYVGDAFGTAHRAHASTAGAPGVMASAAAGRLMHREVTALGGLLHQPRRPFAAALGGAKISGKIETLEALVEVTDRLIVVGGMANTFLAAQGHDVGRSLLEEDRISTAQSILDRARERGVDLLLPTDLVVTDDLDDPQDTRTVPVSEIPADRMAVDIGPETGQRFAEVLRDAASTFWNGPAGVFEKPPFDRGSQALAEAVAGSQGFTAIGGGETVACAKAAGVEEKIDHISTGGGAALALLAGKDLPGVLALARPESEETS